MEIVLGQALGTVLRQAWGTVRGYEALGTVLGYEVWGTVMGYEAWGTVLDHSLGTVLQQS